jgi:hypothetical protein
MGTTLKQSVKDSDDFAGLERLDELTEFGERGGKYVLGSELIGVSGFDARLLGGM